MNSERKQEFLKRKIDADPVKLKRKEDVDHVESSFVNRIGPWEEMFHADACDFTKEQVILYLKDQSCSSLNGVKKRISVLRNYTNFCIQNGWAKTDTNAYDLITKEEQVQCLNLHISTKKIITRTELRKFVSHLYNPCDQFAAMASFEGFSADEIMELTKPDFDFIKNTIRHSDGRVFTYPREMMNYAHMAFSDESYFTGVKSYAYKLDDEEYVIRLPKSVGSKRTGRILVSRLSRYSLRLGEEFSACTMKNLFLCGFVSALEQNKDGLPVLEFIDSNNENYREVLSRYGKDNQTQFTVRYLYLNYIGGKK